MNTVSITRRLFPVDSPRLAGLRLETSCTRSDLHRGCDRADRPQAFFPRLDCLSVLRVSSAWLESSPTPDRPSQASVEWIGAIRWDGKTNAEDAAATAALGRSSGGPSHVRWDRPVRSLLHGEKPPLCILEAARIPSYALRKSWGFDGKAQWLVDVSFSTRLLQERRV